jgi:hypothetical protein
MEPSGFDGYELEPCVGLVTRVLPKIVEWMRNAGDERYFLFLHTYAAHFPYGEYERYRVNSPERGLPTLQALALRSKGGVESDRTDLASGLLDPGLLYSSLAAPSSSVSR